jgi:hypothetical protein
MQRFLAHVSSTLTRSVQQILTYADYDFDLPTSSPSPTDLPLIEEMLRALPQRLAEDINRHFTRPLTEELRVALPGIIQNSLQDYMQPFWRMFSSPTAAETRSAAPPPSDQGDSAYGSLTNDGREGSAPARSSSRSQPSRMSHNQVPVDTLPIGLRNNPLPSEIHVTSADTMTPSVSAWQSSTSSFIPLTHVPEHVSPEAYENYPPMHDSERSRAPTIDPRMAFTGRTPVADPPVTSDLFDFLVPQPPYTLAEPPLDQHPTSASMLRWSNPVLSMDNAPYTTTEVTPNFPSFSYPLQMQPAMSHPEQQQHLHQIPHTQGGNYSTSMAPHTTMASSGMTMATQTTIAPYTTMPPNMSMGPNTSMPAHAVNPAIHEALAAHHDVHQYRESMDNGPAWMWNWTNGEMVQQPHPQQQGQAQHHLPAHVRQSQQNHIQPQQQQQQQQQIQPMQQQGGHGITSMPQHVQQLGSGAASTTSTTRSRPKSKPLLRDLGTEDTDPFYDGRVGRFM